MLYYLRLVIKHPPEGDLPELYVAPGENFSPVQQTAPPKYGRGTDGDMDLGLV